METAFASDGTPLDRIVAAAHAYVSFAQDRPHQFQLLNTPPEEPDALERTADKIDEHSPTSSRLASLTELSSRLSNPGRQLRLCGR
jgi:hypothetical protein